MDEIIKELSIHKDEFFVDGFGQIRHVSGCCPLSFLIQKRGKSCTNQEVFFKDKAKILNLPIYEVASFVASVDIPYYSLDQECRLLRNRILYALSLSEKPEVNNRNIKFIEEYRLAKEQGRIK